jgi:hypothetical protein
MKALTYLFLVVIIFPSTLWAKTASDSHQMFFPDESIDVSGSLSQDVKFISRSNNYSINTPSRVIAYSDGKDTAALPDLQATQVSYKSMTIKEGDAFWIRPRIYNAGPGTAKACYVHGYLSTDNDFNVRNDFDLGEKPINALASGGEQSVQWDFNMPDLQGSENYNVWMVIVVDSRNEVPESDEDNTYKTVTPFTVIAEAPAPPAPDLKANGQNGTISVTAGTPVSITASLAPGNENGKLADWWLAYSSPAGWYSLTSSGWIPGINPLAQYPLFSISPVEIYAASLSAGDHAFYFILDMSPNGIVDSPYYYKVVQVHAIAPTPTPTPTPTPNISGSWVGTSNSYYGYISDVLISFTQSGSAVTGYINSMSACGGVYNVPISGTITGNTLYISGSLMCEGSNFDINFTHGIISGNTINGNYSLYYLNGDFFDGGTFHLEKQ